jgi:hypothetical protein
MAGLLGLLNLSPGDQALIIDTRVAVILIQSPFI